MFLYRKHAPFINEQLMVEIFKKFLKQFFKKIGFSSLLLSFFYSIHRSFLLTFFWSSVCGNMQIRLYVSGKVSTLAELSFLHTCENFTQHNSGESQYFDFIIIFPSSSTCHLWSSWKYTTYMVFVLCDSVAPVCEIYKGL